MDRRTALRNLFIIAGGLVLAPSCSREQGGASIVLNNIQISADQEDLLAALTEVLIPETDSPGAKTLNLHLFVLKMINDCHSPEDQQAFIEGLKKLEQRYRKGQGAVLANFWAAKSEGEESTFSTILRRRTIQGYLNSKYVMQNKLVYQLIPGRYQEAVKIEG